MAIAKLLDCMCWALWALGLWLRYATLQNLIPSFPWIASPALQPNAIQGKEEIKFCHLATLTPLYLSEFEVLDDGLDLLGLAVLQVEDGTLSALARRSPF